MSYFDSIYSDRSLPHRAKTVYMYLKGRSASKGVCWPGINTIATDLSLSRSTVKRALADLEKHGYLERESRFRDNGSHTSILYRVKLARRSFPPGGSCALLLAPAWVHDGPGGREKPNVTVNTERRKLSALSLTRTLIVYKGVVKPYCSITPLLLYSMVQKNRILCNFFSDNIQVDCNLVEVGRVGNIASNIGLGDHTHLQERAEHP